jgi:hypothetical protein
MASVRANHMNKKAGVGRSNGSEKPPFYCTIPSQLHKLVCYVGEREK